MFKSPKSLAHAHSPSLTVIDRNDEFTKTKNKKLQEKEYKKMNEYNFKPTLISKRKANNTSTSTTVSEVGERLYKNAMGKEDRMTQRRQEIEQEQLKQ